MRTIGAALKAHLAQETTTTAVCWKLTRTDSTVMGFTNHDQTLTISGVNYIPARGMSSTATTSSSNLNVDNYDVTAFLESDVITESDLLAGKYDYSTIESFLVNWNDLSMGSMMLAKGRLGEITISNGQFSAEVRSLSQQLQQVVGKRYGRSCRADLGDNECGVTLASYTVTGAVTSETNRRTFKDTGRTEADGYFNYGKLTWTSGNNDGLSMEVKTYTAATDEFVLFDSMPYEIEIGDTYSVYAGCDKLHTTCRDTFNNIVNFRGEPYIPGMDEALRYPDAK
jgi:uncharacterized phage protein (TIGR02218 family)